MRNTIAALITTVAFTTAFAATPASNSNSASNGFDQAADTIGVNAQTYTPHLSSSAIKSAPNDDGDDVIQNGVNTSTS